MSDESVEYHVQALGDHEYLVVIRSGASETESRFRASPDVLDAVGPDSATEERVVRETAAFLLTHQPLIDLPSMIYLEDVAAAYDGYLDQLRQRVAR
ncbi:hypothetical protein [Streptomyces sp. 3N207]|uniref:hypothetical protein n=1 Tax=Streptomyces sp. 3N207 TaxID=3457417 RepID=UPI003FD3C9B6